MPRDATAAAPAAIDPKVRDTLLADWESKRTVLEAAKASEMEARLALSSYVFPGAGKGTHRHALPDGRQLKLTQRENVKVIAANDAVEAAGAKAGALGPEGGFLFNRLITWKPQISVGELAKLGTDPLHKRVRAIVAKLIESSPASPDLKLEEPKAKL